MGCSKSSPIEITFSNTSQESLLRPSGRSNFIVNEKGSIGDYFELLKAVGTDDSGTLFNAREKLTGLFRSVKEISKNNNSGSWHSQEVPILSHLDHPNLLKLVKTIESPRSYYIIYEKIEGESLKSKIKKVGNEGLVSKLILDILSAVNYIHDSEVIHCNLNTDNIIISSDPEPVIKIMGFDFAQNTNEIHEIDLKSINHSFASPEMLKEHFDSKTDIWSIGVITYSLLTGKLPYNARDKFALIESVYSANLDFENPNYLALSSDAKDLIQNLLKQDPAKRFSAKQALSHVWIQQCNKKVSLTYDIIHKLRNFKVFVK